MTASVSMGGLASMHTSFTDPTYDPPDPPSAYTTSPSSSSHLSSYPTPRTPLRPHAPEIDATSPITPGLPDPRRLDRRGLIGVGELATPRYAYPDTGNPRAGMPTSGSEGMLVREGDVRPAVVVVVGKRDRHVSGPRVRGTARWDDPAPDRTTRAGVPRLPSFGDLGGTFKVPTPPGGSSPSSPGQPPPASQRHPLPSTPSAHSILRQFGSARDFSHLPPSPSTASISKIMMKESASMGSLALIADHTTPTARGARERKTVAGATGSPRKHRPDAERERERKSSTSLMDEGTQEVIRRLDGLGKTRTGSLKARARERDGRADKASSGSRGESLRARKGEALFG